MKTFGDKVKEAREILGISQGVLAQKVGVTQRSITAYETGSARPRGTTARKLARALQVSVDYLLDDDITDPLHGMEKDPYLEQVRGAYGARGEEEARILLERNLALFAGGTVSQEAKDAFFEAVMTAYVTCKEEARKTYGRKGNNKLNRSRL
ncbi:MAG: transcriptional repressor DicA [Pelotomaculum sp. PtaB.Bin104]|nr:MAG: transcriptional repressor DicA [Pelotomaculum sp. PtaB.Bin104]